MAFDAERTVSDLLSAPSMNFWGITCESGKFYAQVVGQRFRLTMAVLDPKSEPKDNSDKIVSLLVKRGDCECLLCVLKHGEIHQVNLNLIFDKGENVSFYIRGHGKVCLSGYQLTEYGRHFLNDETGYLCPIAEVKPVKKKTLPETEPESISPKNKKKREKEFITSEDRKTLKSWNSMANKKAKDKIQVLEFEESDESDDDFSVGEEISESEESEECDEEDEEELAEEIMLLQAEDEEEDQKEAVMEPECHTGSRKRKLENKFQPEVSNGNDEDSSDSGHTGSRKRKFGNKFQPEVNNDNREDSSDSDVQQLPTGDTPTPMKTKQTENSSEKKPKKKKKKLNESTSSEKSVNASSPKSKKNEETTPNRNPVQKLEGGIEIQDVIVGKGPVATKGKMVFVFYVGRLQNKEIFDSRLPGRKPFSFKLGAQQVIKGWDIGLQGMKVGGKRKLKIPPNMGYGSSQNEGIPPNSTLFFLVELQAVS